MRKGNLMEKRELIKEANKGNLKAFEVLVSLQN